MHHPLKLNSTSCIFSSINKNTKSYALDKDSVMFFKYYQFSCLKQKEKKNTKPITHYHYPLHIPRNLHLNEYNFFCRSLVFHMIFYIYFFATEWLLINNEFIANLRSSNHQVIIPSWYAHKISLRLKIFHPVMNIKAFLLQQRFKKCRHNLIPFLI